MTDNLSQISTDGINIDKWPINTTVESDEGGKEKKQIELSVWDFGKNYINIKHDDGSWARDLLCYTSIFHVQEIYLYFSLESRKRE